MSNQKDHTALITICVLIGVIATVTLAVATNVYNNSRNVERDEFYAQHCHGVVKTTDNTVEPSVVKYRCGE